MGIIKRKHLKPCSKCGKLTDSFFTPLYTYDDKLLCQICHDNDYGQCEECNLIYPAEEMIWFKNHHFCKECFNELTPEELEELPDLWEKTKRKLDEIFEKESRGIIRL